LKALSKTRKRRWKTVQNARILRVCSAFEPFSALLSGRIQGFQTAAEINAIFQILIFRLLYAEPENPLYSSASSPIDTP